MKKKMISLLLVLSLVVGICPAAFAGEANTISVDTQSKMLQLLVSSMAEKELYGLESLDLSSVSIGSAIPTYSVSGNNLTPASVQLFPVLSNGQITSIFTVFPDENGEIHAQLSSGMVETLNMYLPNSAPFAIIYDDEGAYLYADSTVTLLCEGAFIEEKENLISNLSDDALDNVTVRRVTEALALDVNSFAAQIPAPCVEAAYYLEVSKVLQTSDVTCWAACIASIVNTVKGTNYPCAKVVQDLNGGINETKDMDFVINGISSTYGIQYTHNYAPRIGSATVIAQLQNGYPFFGGFVNGLAHMVVIRGINPNVNTFSVMDPATATYVQCTIGTYSWQYTSPQGITLSLIEYGFHK